MPNVVDYLPVATAAGAVVDSQANFAGSGYQLEGFQDGIAEPAEVNKVWRQSSMIGNAVATFISNMLNISVLDDGNSPSLIANLTAAVIAAAQGVSRLVLVPYSATPVFDASLGSGFEITLTGNVSSSSIVNLIPGQRLIFVVKQDGTGGRTFVPPSSVPMSPISTTAGKTNIQAFLVDLSSNIYQDTPLTVQ
jgi:hypothetical protein